MTPPRGGGRPLLVAVTGHRALPEDDVLVLERAVAAVFSGLERARPKKPLLVVSPCAEGADRLVARVALARGLGLLVLMPMPRRIYERDFDTASRAQFRSLVRASDVAVELPLLPGATPKSVSAPDSAERKRQYLLMGVLLADRADVLIALWNGKPSKKVGGTAQIVESRRAKGGPIYHVLAPNGPADVLRRAVGTRRLIAARRGSRVRP